MNSTASGGETERKARSAKVQIKAHANTSCSFCWFVLTIYPTLKGMTPRDDTTFREHLKSAHGLKQEIQA
jgi:hypothetical protein